MDLNNIRSLKNTLLEGNLPGSRAHELMTPSKRLENISFNNGLPKKSGVLLLFFEQNDSLCTVFMLRPDYGGVHSGQISFPGGKQEDFDASVIDTALREANEELGILSENVEIIGTLTNLYIPPSNFMVTPVIGVSDTIPSFIPDKKEVEKVIVVNFLEFFYKSTLEKMDFVVSDNLTFSAPCYKIGKYKIWGATAMIISEMVELIKEQIGNIEKNENNRPFTIKILHT